MLFRVFGHGCLEALYRRLSQEAEVVGPAAMDPGRDGRPAFEFRPLRDFRELRLDYSTTHVSAKRWFLPFREEIASFRIEGNDWHRSDSLPDAPRRVLFGLHPCDINALNKLDKVLLERSPPLPGYAARRRNTFVVGVDCTPRPSCFCRSMGSDSAVHGFDLFLTDLGGRWFAEILTNDAYDVLRGLPCAEPAEADHSAWLEALSRKRAMFVSAVDTADLPKILDMEFRSPAWRRWGDRCLGCGTCASVCPTCYCYGVEEEAALDLGSARKTKTLYSCCVEDFASVAGGHNFRPDRRVRLKYRYYHKHRGFVEAFEEPLCTGCGRCGEECLAGITVPEVVDDVRGGAE